MERKPDELDAFERYVGEMELSPANTTLFDILKKAGTPLPNPDDVRDVDLKDVLWTVINALWDEGVILYATDHLSDRELYTLLVTDLLLQEHEGLTVTTHLEILGRWRSEDIEVYLRYYADEDARKEWADRCKKSLPEHVDPPYNRDRLLPGH